MDGFSKDSARKFLRYGKTHFINLDKMKDPENTFVLPLLIKPGRAHFVLRTPEDKVMKTKRDEKKRYRVLPYQLDSDVQFRFYYNRHIIPVREEKVPGCK